MEKYFVYLKDNRVKQIAVFESQDEELANRIAQEHGYDNAIWIGENTPPHLWSTWDGQNFIPPTNDYLISIGVITPTIEETVLE